MGNGVRPNHLPRWWPRVTRVENVQGSPGAKRTRWTTLLGTEAGRAVRADFRCVSAAVNERYVWEQEIADTPFERILKRAETEVRIHAAGVGYGCHHRHQPIAARALAARRAVDAAGDREDAERRAERPGERPRRRGATAVNDTKWWGWGGAERRTAVGAEALEMLTELLGPPRRSPPVALDEVRLADPAPLPDAIRDVVGADHVLTEARGSDSARRREELSRSDPPAQR